MLLRLSMHLTQLKQKKNQVERTFTCHTASSPACVRRDTAYLVGTLLGLLSLLLCQVSILLGLAQAPFQLGGNLHCSYHLILHSSLGRLQLLGQLHTSCQQVETCYQNCPPSLQGVRLLNRKQASNVIRRRWALLDCRLYFDKLSVQSGYSETENTYSGDGVRANQCRAWLPWMSSVTAACLTRRYSAAAGTHCYGIAPLSSTASKALHHC